MSKNVACSRVFVVFACDGATTAASMIPTTSWKKCLVNIVNPRPDTAGQHRSRNF